MDISRYWKTIVDTLQDGVMVVDPSGKILALNPAAERLTGYTAAELVGQSCRVLDCTGCDIFGQGLAEKWCGLYAKGEVKAKKCLITNKDNRSVNVIKNASILRDPQGNIIGAVETLTDMSELVRQQMEISMLRKNLQMENGYHGIIGKSAPMQNLFELSGKCGPHRRPRHHHRRKRHRQGAGGARHPRKQRPPRKPIYQGQLRGTQ